MFLRLFSIFVLLINLSSFNLSAFAEDAKTRPEKYCEGIDGGTGKLCKAGDSFIVLKGPFGFGEDAICKPCTDNGCGDPVDCKTFPEFADVAGKE